MNLSTLAANTQGVRFRIHQPNGRTLQLGQDGPVIDWHLHSRNALKQILRSPGRELPRRYLRGEWDVDPGHLPVLLQTLIPAAPPPWLQRQWQVLRQRLTTPRGLTPPARHWQDSSLWLSRICLGDELHQGCAHYREPGLSLEQAQRLRCREISTRLQLARGQQVLDLSAGWGSLALYLARNSGVRVTGLVSTPEQLQFAHSQARQQGLDSTVKFRLAGLRECRGRFDRIISHAPAPPQAAGRPRAHFGHLADRLRTDGLLWVQATCQRRHNSCIPWPQAGRPGLAGWQHTAEKSGLRALAMEDISGYWLQDLHSQLQRYRRRRAPVSQRFGEAAARYWAYLLASEICAIERGERAEYEFLLGHPSGCRPVPLPASGQADETALPLDIARRIPGLARDI